MRICCGGVGRHPLRATGAGRRLRAHEIQLVKSLLEERADLVCACVEEQGHDPFQELVLCGHDGALLLDGKGAFVRQHFEGVHAHVRREIVSTCNTC